MTVISAVLVAIIAVGEISISANAAMTVNSYTADNDEGNVTLFNTMKVVRNKAHGVPTPGL